MTVNLANSVSTQSALPLPPAVENLRDTFLDSLGMLPVDSSAHFKKLDGNQLQEQLIKLVTEAASKPSTDPFILTSPAPLWLHSGLALTVMIQHDSESSPGRSSLHETVKEMLIMSGIKEEAPDYLARTVLQACMNPYKTAMHILKDKLVCDQDLLPSERLSFSEVKVDTVGNESYVTLNVRYTLTSADLADIQRANLTGSSGDSEQGNFCCPAISAKSGLAEAALRQALTV